MNTELINYIESVKGLESEYIFPENEPNTSFGMFSRINIFTGANNTGKSRLLRLLFEKIQPNSKDGVPYTTRIFKRSNFPDVLSEFIDNILNHHPEIEEKIPSDRMHWFENSLKKEFKDYFRKSPNGNEAFFQPGEKLQFLDHLRGINTIYANQHTPQRDIYSLVHSLVGDYLTKHCKTYFYGAGNPENEFDKIYIPILRGMRLLDIKDPSSVTPIHQITRLYSARTEEDYFHQKKIGKGYILTGLELYQEIKSMLLGKPEKRQLIRNFEKFLSDNFFQGRLVTLIPAEGKYVVEIQIGAEDQYEIHNVGDGLQSLIICLFRVFIAVKPTLFFIEEPETHLHPAYQRIFLEVLSRHPQHQYFLTTHSNHLLDMTLDFSEISVFQFSKTYDENNTQLQVKQVKPHDRRILDSLGVLYSSVFLANSTIWIEGKTDRIYIRLYMKKYIESLKKSKDEEKIKKGVKFSKFQEDIHFAFVEYSGQNLSNWSFSDDPKSQEDEDDDSRANATFISSTAFIIADGDTAKSEKKPVCDYLKSMIGDRFFQFSVKEIENLIPDTILKEIIKSRLKFMRLPQDIKKNAVDKIIEISQDDYLKQDCFLGVYIDSLLSLEYKFQTSKSEKALSRKVDFAERTLQLTELTEDWELTEPAIVLVEKIFEHILRNNPEISH